MGLIAYLKIKRLITTLNAEKQPRRYETFAGKIYTCTTPREQALRELKKIGKPAARSLINVLKDKNSNGRMEAAEALGKIGDEAL